MAANQSGVDYLIQVAKEPSRGSAVQLAALKALGRASRE